MLCADRTDRPETRPLAHMYAGVVPAQGSVVDLLARSRNKQTGQPLKPHEIVAQVRGKPCVHTEAHTDSTFGTCCCCARPVFTLNLTQVVLLLRVQTGQQWGGELRRCSDSR
jgi:hypothetical protein